MQPSPRRLMELALDGDRVQAHAETGLPISRVIQQALWHAEHPTVGDADLAQRILQRRADMAAKRSSALLR